MHAISRPKIIGIQLNMGHFKAYSDAMATAPVPAWPGRPAGVGSGGKDLNGSFTCNIKDYDFTPLHEDIMHSKGSQVS